MALLDKANTTTYGNPEMTEVFIGVRNNPAILISGHDMRDMEDLLRQTEGTGVDVYTHSEMLRPNYYPAFKKYSHFVGKLWQLMVETDNRVRDLQRTHTLYHQLYRSTPRQLP